MTAEELDTIYRELCRAVTRDGEPRAALLLARFALLAMAAIDDSDRIREILISASRIEDSHGNPD